MASARSCTLMAMRRSTRQSKKGQKVLTQVL